MYLLECKFHSEYTMFKIAKKKKKKKKKTGNEYKPHCSICISL